MAKATAALLIPQRTGPTPECPAWCHSHDPNEGGTPIHFGAEQVVQVQDSGAPVAVDVEAQDGEGPALVHLAAIAGNEGVRLLPSEAREVARALLAAAADAEGVRNTAPRVRFDQLEELVDFDGLVEMFEDELARDDVIRMHEVEYRALVADAQAVLMPQPPADGPWDEAKVHPGHYDDVWQQYWFFREQRMRDTCLLLGATIERARAEGRRLPFTSEYAYALYDVQRAGRKATAATPD